MNGETDEAGVLTRAYEAVTGRKFVPRRLGFAGWDGGPEGDDSDATAWESPSEELHAEREYEDRQERAERWL